MTAARTITLYAKPGCHLCESCREMLERLAPEYGFGVDEVDVTEDRDTYLRYWASIPVLVVGATILEAALDEHRIRSVLDWEFRDGVAAPG